MANNRTNDVVVLRQRVADAKANLAGARSRVGVAQEQLAAADDAIRELGFDPDRDLTRQVRTLIEEITGDLEEKVEKPLDEITAIIGND